MSMEEFKQLVDAAVVGPANAEIQRLRAHAQALEGMLATRDPYEWVRLEVAPPPPMVYVMILTETNEMHFAQIDMDNRWWHKDRVGRDLIEGAVIGWRFIPLIPVWRKENEVGSERPRG